MAPSEEVTSGKSRREPKNQLGAFRPPYLKRFSDAFNKTLDEAATSRRRADPLFSKFPEMTVRHATKSRNIIDGKPVDLEGANISTSIVLTNEQLHGTDSDALAAAIHDMTTQMMNQQAKMFFKSFETITTATGMNKDMGGQKLTPDMILDQYERMDIGFDESDNPVLPELHVSPDLAERLKNQVWTDDQIARRESILEAKRNQYLARKRFRKLYPPTEE